MPHDRGADEAAVPNAPPRADACDTRALAATSTPPIIRHWVARAYTSLSMCESLRRGLCVGYDLFKQPDIPFNTYAQVACQDKSVGTLRGDRCEESREILTDFAVEMGEFASRKDEDSWFCGRPAQLSAQGDLKLPGILAKLRIHSPGQVSSKHQPRAGSWGSVAQEHGLQPSSRERLNLCCCCVRAPPGDPIEISHNIRVWHSRRMGASTVPSSCNTALTYLGR